ncbi:Plasmodium exported protein, unknown function [Plasmodium ovale wallikeri]|uniref:Uncharacterized protein n=1 Tax=Plasmodium ovale wallikeri TaxID=864142 RepID=A0A1A8YHW6_PLAOA|nr:Plasmodium exported protein, unknown function [Plasmodium ovale wallikeri]SBT57174.1 Plasmodium exported protein, unknown function [Plasmodium ovale wallikeri]
MMKHLKKRINTEDAHRNIHCRVVYLLHGVTPILRTGRLLSFLCGKKKNDKNSQEKTKVKDNDGKQTNKNSIKEAKKKKKAHVNALLKDYFNAKNDEEREKQYDLIRYTCEKENLDFGKMIYNYYICNVKKSKFSCIRDILFLLSISMIAGSITLGVTTALSIVNLPGVAVALAISSFVGLYALDLFSH